ncbi:MAG: VTT domain-containing protein [Synergistales bacterium]|nr:VTT domain-containing protein [Synergistales bacterium]
MTTEDPFFVEGRNCWKRAFAHRLAFLVDGDAYFSAVVSVLQRARRSIFIVGWEMDSRVPLLRGPEAGRSRYRLSEFLNTLAAKKPELHIYVLLWDFSMIYALERENFPVFRLGWKTHRRVHFHLDGEHPVGASHHQKIVVADGAVAFTGGLDLTRRRWDTPEHPFEQPLRRDPGGKTYGPFHDVQAMADGEVARHLEELARERWYRATGERPRRMGPTGRDIWPRRIEPEITDAGVAVARTMPAHSAYPEIREVEALCGDILRAAKGYIYIENQYLTSTLVEEILTDHLQSPQGPDILLMLAQHDFGLLEQGAMGGLGSRLLQRLLEADRYGRLKVCFPVVRGGEGQEAAIKVHSKVLIVDDALLRVGTSNMNNRSMGLDTECDLALEAWSDPRLEESIRAFRNRLIGEHLDVSPEALQKAVEREGSLLRGIASLPWGERKYVYPMEVDVPRWFDVVPLNEELLDPERPVTKEEILEKFLPEPGREGAQRGPLLQLLLFAALLGGMALAWRYTGLQEVVNLEEVIRWVQRAQGLPGSNAAVIGVFLLGSLTAFPLTLLIVATAFVFDSFHAFTLAMTGSLAGAYASYMLGHKMGRDMVRRLAGQRINRLSRRLARQGIAAVAVIRLLPLAPFTIINVVAGASHINLRDFMLGSLLGLVPGVAAMTIFTEQLRNVMMHPTPGNILGLLGIAFGVGGMGYLLRRLLNRREEKKRAREARGMR